MTKKMPRRFAECLLAISVFLLTVNGLEAQEQPYHDEIAAFRKQDSLHPVPPHPIVFVGSSSFRIWTKLAVDFPGYPVINRGFGGSTLPDVILYAGDIILPYHPRQIVIYCGDNDLGYDSTVTGTEVYRRFTHLYELIRGKLPVADILFISIKPSPSRAHLLHKIEEANHLISVFLSTQAHAAFADVYHPMLDKEGRPRKELFLGDMLHMNAKGYELWKKIILPYLDK
jgi:lysophospholipase L1-like esterase